MGKRENKIYKSLMSNVFDINFGQKNKKRTIVSESYLKSSDYLNHKSYVKSLLYEAGKMSKEDFLDSTFENPDTGKQVKVRSALQYDQNTAAYKIAKAHQNKAGFGEEDLVDKQGGGEEEQPTQQPKQEPPQEKEPKQPQEKPEEQDDSWMEGKDGWEILDDERAKVKKIRKYSDKEYEEETGEYFENDTTKQIAPNAFKDEADMIAKMKAAKPVFLSSEKMQNMSNTDVGDILDASEEGGRAAMLKLGKERAKEYGKDWDRLEKGIQSNSAVPAPMALRDKNGDLHLLAGNTRLMSFTASGKKLPIKVIDYDGEFNYDEGGDKSNKEDRLDKVGSSFKTSNGKTLYSVGGGYYADSPGGEAKYIRAESIEILDEDITAKNQKGQTITVKPLTRKEKKEIANKTYEESESRAKEIYGEDLSAPLLQNSKTSDELLNQGYSENKYWTAPGNAGSAYNENVSNEGVKILEKYPDLSEEELAAILFRRTRGTKLGKQQKSTRVHSPSKKNTGAVPDGLTKDEVDLYRSAIIAARSAKSKYNRAVDGASAAQAQVGFGSNTTIQSFGGTSRVSGKKGKDANTPDDVVADLEALVGEIESADKCYIYDDETGKVYEIPKKVLISWVKVSGGGENASDTAVITKDENGNLIFDGWSDKKAFNDLQGNSTLNDDYAKQSSNLSKLEQSNQIDKSTASQAKSIIDRAKKKSSQIEADYKKAPKKEAQYFGTLFGEDRERIIQHLKDQEMGYDKDGTKNHVRNAMKHYGVSTHEELLDKLVDESTVGKPSADRLKVINRAADMERKYLKSQGNKIPAGLDTKRILSDAREQALNLQRETIEELNRLKGKTKSGKEKRLGDLLGFQETIDFLHIDKIEQPETDDDYTAILKRNTQLVMAGVAVKPKTIKECLDVDDLTEYEDDFEVVTEEELIYDKETQKYTTGKIVYIYALSKDGSEKRYVAKKVYRSKSGATGKTSNTIEWSNDMQQCFDSK